MTREGWAVALTAEQIIEQLALEAHPEGGYYRETWRDKPQSSEQGGAASGTRGAGTAIYYLLRAGERSHWHRVDAVEIWHYYAGARLALSMSEIVGGSETVVLGADILAGERPQVIIAKDVWQSARTLGDWALAGCTVSPAFDFTGFELAPQGWSPSP
jgi:predicted cupin superfamily sugar epimerase